MGAITIRLAGLTAGRGGEALCGPLDIALSAGEAMTVTGANGAGKSTLLRTLAGLLPPLAGAVHVAGALAPDGEPAEALHDVAHYLGHRNALKGTTTLGANLAFWHDYLGGERAGAGQAVERALDGVGLAGLRDIAAAHLSAGQQRRAALARLSLVPRPVWLLDEPTAALDAASVELFAAIAKAHLRGGGILIAATHQPLDLPGPTLALEPAACAEMAEPFA